MKVKKGVKIIIPVAVLLVLLLLLFLKWWYESRDYEFKLYYNHAEITKYKGTDKNVVIPDRIFGKKVTIIKSAFKRNDGIESVELPKYLEEIGGKAFKECKDLETVWFGENTRVVRAMSFDSCIKLKNVYLNEGLEEIEYGAFEGTEQLEKIVIPSSVTRIGSFSFKDSGLKEVIFQGEKARIELRTFENTPWIEKQEGFLICGDNALVCYNGTEEVVQVPDGVKYISASFENAKEYKEVYLPDTAVEIMDVSWLRKKGVIVYIPSSVTTIYADFYSTDDLGSVTIVTTAGSYAEKFAKENGFNLEIVDEIVYPNEN